MKWIRAWLRSGRDALVNQVTGEPFPCRHPAYPVRPRLTCIRPTGSDGEPAHAVLTCGFCDHPFEAGLGQDFTERLKAAGFEIHPATVRPKDLVVAHKTLRSVRG